MGWCPEKLEKGAVVDHLPFEHLCLKRLLVEDRIITSQVPGLTSDICSNINGLLVQGHYLRLFYEIFCDSSAYDLFLSPLLPFLRVALYGDLP